MPCTFHLHKKTQNDVCLLICARYTLHYFISKRCYHFQAKEITWDTKRTFPPLRSCLFSHSVTAVTFLGDPSVGSGLPRGTIVYSTQAIPNQVFYIQINSNLAHKCRKYKIVSGLVGLLYCIHVARFLFL